MLVPSPFALLKSPFLVGKPPKEAVEVAAGVVEKIQQLPENIPQSSAGLAGQHRIFWEVFHNQARTCRLHAWRFWDAKGMDIFGILWPF